MTNFSELAKVHTETANAIATSEGSFDDIAAELVLRNTAVIADRLDAHYFSCLPTHVIDTVLDAASVAKQLAPLDPRDTERYSNESVVDHHYRVSVWAPLHALQSKVASGDFDKGSSSEIDRIKSAVRLGSTAFTALLGETIYHPTIIDTEGYFWGNTSAAASRVSRAARPND